MDITVGKKEIAQRIKQRRKQLFPDSRGRAKFARDLGLLPQTYAGYEKNRCDFDFLKLFAQKTKTSLIWLLTGLEEPGYENSEKRSIHIPYIISMRMLNKILTETTGNDDEPLIKQILKHVPTFLSFPKIYPFTLIEGKQMLGFLCDEETGMVPIVCPGDIVTIYVDDKTPQEERIYLCFVKGELKLRYANQEKSNKINTMIFWAKQEEFKTTIKLSECPVYPILGRVFMITRQL